MVAAVEEGVVAYTYASLEGHDYMSLRGPAGVLHDIFVDPAKRKWASGGGSERRLTSLLR